MPRPIIGRGLVQKGLSIALLVASSLFLAQVIYRNADALSELTTSPMLMSWVAGGSFAYSFAILLLAAAWGILLRTFTSAPVTPTKVIEVYGRSQLAKYIPGNVMHYLGRQMLGQRHGWPQPAMAVASIGETGAISLVALVLVIILGGSNLHVLARIAPSEALTGGLVAGSIGLGFLAALRHTPLGRRWLGRVRVHGKRILAAGLSTILLYTGFFIIIGLIMNGVLGVLTKQRPDALFCVYAFSGAWLLGYVLPGVPGGIGVRETALTLLLEGQTSEPIAVLVAVAMRCITAVGDGLHFLLAVAVARHSPKGGQ